MWVKWSGTQDSDCCGTFGAVLARQSNGQFSDDIIALNAANPLTARIVWRQSGGPAPILITGTAPVGTNWHHLVVTFGPAGSTLYVDGASQGSAGGAALNNNPATILSIGAWAGDGGGFATASLDDVAIWDQPLNAAQAGQLAAQTKTPLDFAIPENAVYWAGDGRLSSNDELRQTMLPLGPRTYYFRTKFPFADDPARTELKLDLAVDDGAVFYLNGTEVYRHNMPGGTIQFGTLASAIVGDAPLLNGLPLPTGALTRGTNVFAVEVHQAEASDLGMVFAAGLSASVMPAPVLENRPLITRNEDWRYEASNRDPGNGWRDAAFDDSGWSNAAALFYAGDGDVDGVAPDRLPNLTATASSEYTPDNRLVINAVNGAGLTGDAHGNTPSGTMWLIRGTLTTPNDLNPQITFDVGTVAPLRWMKVWNYNEDLPGRPELLARGVASADILTGVSTGALSSFRTGQSFNKAPGTVSDFSQLIDLGGVNARFVRLDKLTNFPGGDFRLVGLSEVQFFREADLKRTALPLGSTTYYFRKTFLFAGDPALARLLLDLAVDDGAVVYLNGAEVRRVNMPAGPVGHTTLASVPVAHATFTGPSEISSSNLRNGLNTLAVEVHETATNGDTDMIFGAMLSAVIAQPSPESFAPGDLIFNELTAAGVNFELELFNRGSQPLNTAGYLLRRAGVSPDATYIIPAQTLLPGAFQVLDLGAAGFSTVPGDKLFLMLPGERGVADAIEVHARPRSRWPDGAEDWLTPDAVTLGAANQVTRHSEVVINEIFYHGLPTLEVPPVVATNVIIPLTNFWRYEQSGTDLGTAWRLPAYDDSAWPSGRGLLYLTPSALPAPKNTELTLGPTTYYFRASFVYTGAPAILSLSLRHIVDDGVVLYLNGNEFHRFNLPGVGVINYTNNASASIVNATLRAPVSISLTNLILGTNVLAAEVHQAAVDGGDVVFGCELTAGMETSPRIPYRGATEEWIELYNRGAQPANLSGWRLDEGIDFRFAADTMLPAGGYLVVAKDPPALSARFPEATITGPYTNRLSRQGERIVLKDAADNTADAVRYSDDGRWPEAADGGGASLELRDPRADHDAGEAWAASDERARTSWRTYSYRGVAAASAVGPDGQWREFVMGLLGPGEVLLDDISVLETPSTTPVQLIQNGTFDTGTNKWRIIGNHHGEVIDDPEQPGNKVLRLVATGSTEHMSNHGETTLANSRDVVNGREYLISFRARWVSGSRQLHTRLYFNRLAHTTLLDAPLLHGTPGSRNTAFAANIGPTFQQLRHDPAVPGPFEPATISVHAADPDGVATLTLWWNNNGGAWHSVPMLPSDTEASRTDGYRQYAATLPGQAAGTVIQFYVQGTDTLGAGSLFPATGTNSRALYKVDDGLAATNGLHNFRLVTLNGDADQLHRQVNLMSNERIGCTVIYDEREIFYDVGLRLKGSEHSRTTTPRLGFNVGFYSAQSFRGVHHTVAIDRSESTGFGQREMLIHQTLNHAGGVPTKYHDLIQVMAPRAEHTGSAELQLARYTDVFLDDQYEHGADGTVFEYELVYQLNPPTDTGTAEGNKIPNPDSVVGTAIRNLGDDKENYRWTFLIKNNEDKDDYSRVMQFAKTMEQGGTPFISQMTNIVDVEQWLRATAVNALSGAGDSYGGDGAQHNVQFYHRPDGRMIYFPHDIDAFFDSSRPIIPNGDLSKFLTVPLYARSYYSHVLDIIATTYNGNYLARWASHFGRLLPAQNFAGHLAFIVTRVNTVMTAVNAAVPNVAFAITSNAGNDFSTTNDFITLTGTGNLSVQDIEVNGVRYPLTWTSVTAWSLRLPLYNGPNLLNVQGLNRSGLRLTNAVDTVVVTNNGAGNPLPVVINEWMADNSGAEGLADPLDGQHQDWFELYNPNTNAVNLSGFSLTDNLSLPNKSPVPLGTIIPAGGFLLVWADNQVAQNALDTNGNLHAAFQLNNDGEIIALFSPGGVAQHIVAFGEQVQNVSQGLFPDGATNAIYFMTNFTPRAANTLADRLRIRTLSFLSGTVTLNWSAIPGRSYRVEYKDALDAPIWTPLGAPVPAVENTVTLTDTPAPATHRFYRIRLVE